jgi:antibiotic biosynthesis monooxygenase (ABM) superfamily enzyme
MSGPKIGPGSAPPAYVAIAVLIGMVVVHLLMQYVVEPVVGWTFHIVIHAIGRLLG